MSLKLCFSGGFAIENLFYSFYFQILFPLTKYRFIEIPLVMLKSKE